jgi:thiol-disulfide isomerase/thioredoxin
MTRRTTLAAVAIAAILALGAGIYAGSGRLARTARTDASALLAVTLPNTEGKEESLGQWKGKLLIVNFWATWCAPCREEMPEFVRMQKAYGDKGVQFVGIAVDEGAKVRQFATEIGLNYPALIGGYGAMELSRTLGNTVMALPFTVVVDRSGTIVHTQLGPVRLDQLRALIDKLG